MPFCWSAVITGETSVSMRTRSPMTIASLAPVRLNATHDPSANAGRILIPSTVTLRSLRGKLYFIAPSDCGAPDLPIALVTADQSSDRVLLCALAVAAVTRATAIAQQK